MAGNPSKPIATADGVDVGAEAAASGGAGAESTPEDTFPLLHLPNEILELIPRSLDTETGAPSQKSLCMMAHLARTNRRLHGIFQPILNKRRVQELLRDVLSGHEAQAKAMIAANPNVLLERATVTTAEGRTYENVTSYEAALYAGDTQMCEMMHVYFERLTLADGDKERVQQYNNVFPEGVDAVVKAQEAYDFDVIITAISAASDAEVRAQLDKKQNDSLLCQALNTFREEFTKLTQAEKHANLKHLLAAFTLYANDTRLDAWNDDKLDLFWRQAIGFVQRYLPACDKQVFHQGLYDVVENNERFGRFEEFKYVRGYSLRVTSDSSGPGFDFAATPSGWWGRGPRNPAPRTAGPAPPDARRARVSWKTYVEQKRQTCRTYADADRPCVSVCDSMM